MAIKHILNIKKALEEKKFPTVMMWNRLEGRPKTHHFDRALKAEVRDALWMLTRQWQIGEFKADDAGSPVFAKVHINTSQLDTYKAAKQNGQPFEKNIPLEVKAEQKKIPFTRNNKEISIDLRLQMGNYWLTLINNKGLNYRDNYIRLYGFELPVRERSTDYIYAHKDVWQQYAAIAGRSVDGYKLYAYLVEAGNAAADGVTGNDPDKTDLNDLGIAFIQWYERLYYQPKDEKNNAWLPEQLEYQFDCSANSVSGTRKNLHAEEYYQGSPEWYVFDIEETATGSGVQEEVKFTSSFIPAHIEFDGMPNTRWWKFEDGKTNLGDVKPSTTDLGKLLLMEFGLIYANDWFVVPYTLPVGTLSTIAGLTVKNNFGEKFWIESTEKGEDKDVWSMFKMNSVKQNSNLFLSPTSLKVHESEPLEDIVLIRDEISNMVWGIEKIVSSAIGTGCKGSEMGIQVRQYHEKIVLKEWLRLQSQANKDMIASFPTMATGLPADKSYIEQGVLTLVTGHPERDLIISKLSDNIKRFTASFEEILDSLQKVNISLEDLQQEFKKTVVELIDQLLAIIKAEFENASDKTNLNATIRYLELQKNNAYAASISYLAMTEVPENWIPFTPVHKKNDNREVQLQRATMLRFIEGDQQVTTDRIKPQTSLLREGLEVKPTAKPYFIHEEEVPRSGVRVYQSYQRTRWTNGEVFLWMGIKKKPGRGEGSSGLAFDQIISRT